VLIRRAFWLELGPFPGKRARRIDLFQRLLRSANYSAVYLTAQTVIDPDAGSKDSSMDYRGIFEEAVDTLRSEKRYRVFADLERIAGRFPRAIYRDDADNARED